MITIYENIFDTTHPHYIEIETAFERIAQGKSKQRILNLRKATSKDEIDNQKKYLPCVCFGGTFPKRNAQSITSYSNYMVLDFDGFLNIEMATEKKNKLKQVDFIFACWISPSGKGVKAIVKVADGKRQKEHFDAMLDIFPELDKSGSDICRVCYESFDDKFYCNENAVVFTQTKKIERVLQTVVNDNDSEKFTKLLTWITNKGDSFSSGSRNHFMYKVASACCRFGIREDRCLSLCNQSFLYTDSTFKQSEAEQVIKSAYKSNHFNSAEFENKEFVDKVTRGVVKLTEAQKEQILEKDIIYGKDVLVDAVKLYNYGYQSAETTNVPTIDEFFKWKKGELTLLSGIGNYGKSTLLKYMLLMKAICSDWKCGMFVPEDFPAHEFYHDLVEMYFGCNCTPSNQNRPPLNEYTQIFCFIEEHFYFIYPKDDESSPEYVKAVFLELIIKYKINVCIIDPFNQMANDYSSTGGRTDKYLELVLSNFRRFALDNSVCFLVVAHPTKMKLENGNYPCPNVFDMADGAMWNNKMDNILMYHLPNRQTEPDSNLCEFHSKKIRRRKIVGKIGFFAFEYVPKLRRFIFDGCDYMSNAIGSKFNYDYGVKIDIDSGDIVKDFTIPLNESINNFENETNELDLTPRTADELRF